MYRVYMNIYEIIYIPAVSYSFPNKLLLLVSQEEETY